MVPPSSAIVRGAPDVESVAINADHNNMVKFDSREDDGYQKVSGHLQLLVEKAPNAVRARWTKEKRIEKGMITT